MMSRRAFCILLGTFAAFETALCFASCHQPREAMRLTVNSELYAQTPLNVAVVGGGPSGLLLAHLLLSDEDNKVTVLERREDPRNKDTEQRAYALGIGIRGRTAIRQVDEDLWQAVKRQGYESERFQLHVGKFVLTLRSEKDSVDGVEPSLLTFQSELCAALTEELEQRHTESGRLQVKFGTRAASCDLETMNIVLENGSTLSNTPFDLIVGCDGVNSIVRSSIEKAFPAFESTMQQLPGKFKVVRLHAVPPSVDPTSVSLILPKKGSVSAFVEPTGRDGSCCILFAGQGDDSFLSETNNVTAVGEALENAFPQWKGGYDTIAEQLVAQPKAGTASSVVCNIYNYGGKAALAGDAAHATGGVSGQGVNSALADSVSLAKCIRDNRDNLAEGLLKYSCSQVPEGKALYDLSFGPRPRGFRKLRWTFRKLRDSLFRGRWGIGRPPLQTQLTTDLTAFAEIRREKDKYYDEPFPVAEDFRVALADLHSQAVNKAGTSKSISA